jgi:hypothetical protein
VASTASVASTAKKGTKKPHDSIGNKQRQRNLSNKSPKKEIVAEAFAYPNDDSGLPLPVAGFPAIPGSLLEYTRREMKHALAHRDPTEADAIVEWAISNPFCPKAHAFRMCLKYPHEIAHLRRLYFPSTPR